MIKRRAGALDALALYDEWTKLCELTEAIEDSPCVHLAENITEERLTECLSEKNLDELRDRLRDADKRITTMRQIVRELLA